MLVILQPKKALSNLPLTLAHPNVVPTVCPYDSG